MLILDEDQLIGISLMLLRLRLRLTLRGRDSITGCSRGVENKWFQLGELVVFFSTQLHS